ncbi:alpha/beta hydrolase [Roseococcus sp. YIM B11640]|uniref:alpha/beta hydrolase n=1 Tax=Roseococcus sp. YIM B11640 TaxID=3133973 RepID=UPI003C798749
MSSRICLLLVLAVSLIGCAARPGMEVLRPAGAVSADGQVITVQVVTTRARADAGSNSFTNTRSRTTNFAEYAVSVPPTHRAGQIEWPRVPADPATSFTTLRSDVLTRDSFEAGLRGRRCENGGKRVFIFVHGFNTNFPEALFRVVQMTADTNPDVIPILFAWPSDAEVLGYVADRDSAMYSRDALANLLARVAELCRGEQVTIIGHSMGAWLTVEALRQLRLAGRQEVLQQLRVALASPDIDVDVFRTQVAVIGPLSPPMAVLVSRDDRALSVSSRLSGDRRRLGRLDVDNPEVQEAARLAQIIVIDITEVAASDGFNHDRYVGFATAYARMMAAGHAPPRSELRHAGAFVFNSVGTVLASPFRLAGRMLSPD